VGSRLVTEMLPIRLGTLWESDIVKQSKR
jgi:hypothetical protein